MKWLRGLLGWKGEPSGPGEADRIDEADVPGDCRHDVPSPHKAEPQNAPDEPSDEPGEWSDDDFPEVIEMPLEDSIDLHHFSPKEIPDVVDCYLEAAQEKGFREVRLIHGRGKGVQRRRVQSLLSRHPLVSSFRDAPVERGGWGATVALLREGESSGRDPGR